jgi:hypothetical protein
MSRKTINVCTLLVQGVLCGLVMGSPVLLSAFGFIKG